MKSLIVYFSRKGENYYNGGIKFLKKGNTEIVAETIQKITNSDIFEIETIKPYSDNYHECIVEAKNELNNKERPALKKYIDSIDQYDKIFVGYPNWWGTAPMSVFTFLEHYDLSGKILIPFCTNEGSGMGDSEKDLQNEFKNVEFKKGLSIQGSKSSELRSVIERWVKKSLE